MNARDSEVAAALDKAGFAGASVSADKTAVDAGSGRVIALSRTSRETRILLRLDLDGAARNHGQSGSKESREAADSISGSGARISVRTGIGFLDHMLTSLATHAGWSLELSCTGDLVVDDHHSAEDCAILLGEAVYRILRKSGKTTRFGYAYAPLDDSLARAVVDLSGRPYCVAVPGFSRPAIGELACENIIHFFESFAYSARMNLQLDVLRGTNDHHRAEAAFKALAIALGMALEAVHGPEGAGANGAGSGFASTKGEVNLVEIDEKEWAKPGVSVS